MYYVYEYYVIDTDEVFYVGKGCNNRENVYWQRNRIFKEYYDNNKCDHRIVKTFDSEEDAFRYENERIFELKAIGQCKANVRSGGFGGSTSWWNDAYRQMYSDNNVMKRDEQRERMSINNPMKNPDIAKIVGIKHGRPVIINGIRYNSVADVMEAYGTTYSVVSNWCRKGINPLGEVCRFEDQEQVEFTDSRYNTCGAKPIIYNGKRYDAVIDCARDIGHDSRVIINWAKRGFDPNGVSCRYENDDRELSYENAYSQCVRHTNCPMIVNGIRYQNADEASAALNISKKTIQSYANGTMHSSKYICTYDNQQPSQTNSSKSSLEGSTTNE